MEGERVGVAFGVDFGGVGEEKLVPIAPVEDDEAESGEAEDEGCNA